MRSTVVDIVMVCCTAIICDFLLIDMTVEILNNQVRQLVTMLERTKEPSNDSKVRYVNTNPKLIECDSDITQVSVGNSLMGGLSSEDFYARKL